MRQSESIVEYGELEGTKRTRIVPLLAMSERGVRMARYKAPYRLIKPTKHGGIYYYRLGADPKRIRHSTGCTTEKQAREYCEKILKSDEHRKTSLLFKDYAKDFFVEGKCSYLRNREMEDKPIGSKLASDYRGYINNYLIPYFGNQEINGITSMEIRDWRSQLKEGKIFAKNMNHPPANATLNHVLRIMGIVLAQAEEEKMILQNPMNKVKSLSKRVYKKRDILTKEEIEKLFPNDDEALINIWGDYEKASMLFLVLTSGMRSGELRALQWSDIDWKNRGIRITKAITAENEIGQTKGKKPRGTVAPLRAFELLKKWKDLSSNQAPTCFIYPGKDGKSFSSAGRLRSALQNALSKVGINTDGSRNIVVHSLRHTYNSTMYYVLPPEVLRGTIGHETEAMTERYSHLSPDDAIKQYGKKYRKAIEKSW